MHYIAYQSVACHERTSEAARIASDVSRENVLMASCSPFRATPRCSYAIFPTAGQPVRYARCIAEKASRECKT